jgi:hypothetical protein
LDLLLVQWLKACRKSIIRLQKRRSSPITNPPKPAVALWQETPRTFAWLRLKVKNQCAAELEAAYKPSPKAHYEARVAKADADFKVAKEKCNDKGGNIKDVCVKEADAAFTSAKADAKVQEKTTDATTKANEKTVEARTDANKTVNDARKDATDDKTDAQYTVAKEKCNAFADAAKDLCLEDTKAKFGRK